MKLLEQYIRPVRRIGSEKSLAGFDGSARFRIMNRSFPKYREWIQSLDCAECGESGPSECHHLKGDFNMSGAGLKAPDWVAMPLCRRCHADIHAAVDGWRDVQREALIRTLIKAFLSEIIIVQSEGD